MSVPKPVYISGVWIVRTYSGTIETSETERFGETWGGGGSQTGLPMGRRVRQLCGAGVKSRVARGCVGT